MSNEQGRAIGELLDPRAYVEHVTRTALVLEQLAKDVAALRTESSGRTRDLEELRGAVSRHEKDFAVFQVETTAAIKKNEERLTSLEERLRWLNRLVVGALVTGILSGLGALIFHSLSVGR